MIRVAREVDLLSYLPPFMAEFKEIAVTLDAENPEFVLVWKAADRVLQNEFIETADEYGISRFEKILNILPSKEDTLESRRSRVFARWFNTIPYTLKALIAKLEALCGDNDFTIIKEYDNYTITIIVDLEMFGQVDELDYIIESMIPCNMIVISRNEIPCQGKRFCPVQWWNLLCAGFLYHQRFPGKLHGQQQGGVWWWHGGRSPLFHYQ